MNPNLPTGETMSEGEMLPPTEGNFPALPELGATASFEQCLPADVLKQPDDQEALQTPEVGDEVSYSVTGKVSRIEGDMVYVTPSQVNGQEIKLPAAPEAPEGAGEMESLETEARNMV